MEFLEMIRVEIGEEPRRAGSVRRDREVVNVRVPVLRGRAQESMTSAR